jgi:glutathione synthase/RimK-type ligase-like ATP-grasp enzyme
VAASLCHILIHVLDKSINGGPSQGFMRAAGQICIIGSNLARCWSIIRTLPSYRPKFIILGPLELEVVGKSKGCIKHVVSDLADRDATIGHISALLKSFDNLIMVPADVDAAKIMALAHQSGLHKFPFSNAEVIAQLDDKQEFLKLCARCGARAPSTECFNDKFDLFNRWPGEKLKYPFVIKPTNRENAEGVKIINSLEHYQTSILNREYDFMPLLAQSFVPGHDIDISTFSEGGEILHYAVQTRVNGKLIFVHNSQILAYAKEITHALAYSGILHIDARQDSATGAIYLIEANPRVFGSMSDLALMDLNFTRVGIELVTTGVSSAKKTVIGEGVTPLQVILRAIRGAKLNREQRLFLKNAVYDVPLLLRMLLRRLVRGYI